KVVSRVPGAPPRVTADATLGPSITIAVTPVAAPDASACPTRTPGMSVMRLWRGLTGWPRLRMRAIAQGMPDRKRRVAVRWAASHCAPARFSRLLDFEVGDLAVRTLLPDVENIAVLLLARDDIAAAARRNVTLGVIGDVAKHGLEDLARVHH